MTKELIEELRKTPGGFLPGWGGMPEYTNWMDEQKSWKTDCYIGDWSFLPAFEVQGPDALKLFSDICVNGFSNYEIGQAKHAIPCNTDGKVITDGILLRLSEDRFCIQSIPAFYAAYWLSTGKYDATGRFVKWFFYQVQGPKALALMEKLVDHSLSEVRFMRYTKVKIAGHDVLALRQGMSGELGGFELQGENNEKAKEIYDAVLRAGAEFGIRRLGFRSAMINHLEAWYPTIVQHYVPAMFGPDMADYRQYLGSDVPLQQGLPPAALGYLRRRSFNLTGSFQGEDISDYYRSPIELGWTKNIKFDHDFIGRAALEKEVENPRRVGVTLEFNSDDILDLQASLFRAEEPYSPMELPHHMKAAAHSSEIRNDGRLVGLSAYPAYSLHFRKVLSIACVEVPSSEPGTEVTVVWGEPHSRQKLLRAKVAPVPYKRDNRRAPLTDMQPA